MLLLTCTQNIRLTDSFEEHSLSDPDNYPPVHTNEEKLSQKGSIDPVQYPTLGS